MKKTGRRSNLISNAVLATMLGLGSDIARADETAAFLEFDRLNAHDIALARLAQGKSQSNASKALAQMIIHDHEPIQREARGIADELGIKYPGEPDESEYSTVMSKLSQTPNADFDKAYLDHELPFSNAFVQKLKSDILPAVTHAKLQTYLSNLVPKFEMHLKHIEHTAKAVNAGNGAHEMQHDMHGHEGKHQMH